jgi:shikimate dehydrogenase
MKEITGKTKLLGVIGDPIEHSLSPIMHNAALTEMGIDYVYLPFPVKSEKLGQAIDGFAALAVHGFNVTIPHKQAVLPYLTEVTEIAQVVGAVNTVLRTDTGWLGTNTDVEGFIAPLKPLQQDWANVTALILGNGGAARAVVAGCVELGIGRIRIAGRDSQKLQDFSASWSHAASLPPLRVHQWETLPDLLPHIDLLINTTPIGMYPHINASPLNEAALDRLPSGAIVYDLIYTPNPTRLLQQARARELAAIDGLEMLVQQGAAALQLWLQQPVPVNTMRQALRQYLGLEPTTSPLPVA